MDTKMYKVGVKIEGKVLWTLDGYTNNIKTFATKQEAEEFGQVVWPNVWVVGEMEEQE